MTVVSPKRWVIPGSSPRASWFTYYAGYSDVFVADVFKNLPLATGTAIADPWNGAGTTTQIAHDRGFACQGFDINPAMVVVAKARLLSQGIKPSHVTLAKHICKLAAREPTDTEIEPLTEWFGPTSAAALRSLQRAVARLLVNDQPVPHVKSMSQLACFFYLALFRTTRSFLRPFTCSNPTWIKSPPHPGNRVRPSPEAISSEFQAQVSCLGQGLGALRSPGAPKVDVGVADSTALPLEDESIDHIVTSPPYCTRIDYIVATRPELAVLGTSPSTAADLRRATLGGVITKGPKPTITPVWGNTCLQFLDRVKTHPSRASASYYLNTHLLYFDKLSRSLSEMTRALKPQGSCVIVVQDSFYKDVHNNLPSVVVEMAANLGWSLTKRNDFRLASTKAAMNSRHLKYRHETTATESVLWFRKI